MKPELQIDAAPTPPSRDFLRQGLNLGRRVIEAGQNNISRRAVVPMAALAFAGGIASQTMESDPVKAQSAPGQTEGPAPSTEEACREYNTLLQSPSVP